MTIIQITAILVTLTALFSSLNYRYIRLPTTIGVMLIGLEVLVLTFTRDVLFAGFLAVPALLLARWLSVGLPVVVMRRWRKFTPGAVTIMTWGGLRGGISVALALSLPAARERDLVLAVTYVLVIFSILFQGLTLRRVVSRVMRPTART